MFVVGWAAGVDVGAGASLASGMGLAESPLTRETPWLAALGVELERHCSRIVANGACLGRRPIGDQAASARTLTPSLCRDRTNGSAVRGGRRRSAVARSRGAIGRCAVLWPLQIPEKLPTALSVSAANSLTLRRLRLLRGLRPPRFPAEPQAPPRPSELRGGRAALSVPAAPERDKTTTLATTLSSLPTLARRSPATRRSPHRTLYDTASPACTGPDQRTRPLHTPP